MLMPMLMLIYIKGDPPAIQMKGILMMLILIMVMLIYIEGDADTIANADS